MTNSDWKDAPEWADYTAQDANGERYWHRFEPHARKDLGIWILTDDPDENVEYAGVSDPPNKNWKSTLERRPT